MTHRDEPTGLEHADLGDTTPLDILLAWMEIRATAFERPDDDPVPAPAGEGAIQRAWLAGFGAA
jgi:hypothetical protein